MAVSGMDNGVINAHKKECIVGRVILPGLQNQLIILIVEVVNSR